MTPYRRILLIMTEAQANAALSRAMALSAASGASLHVLGIHESGVLRLPHELQEAPLHSASFMHFSTELKALLDEQSFVGARPGFEAVETSNPRDQLPACIARYAPDLVIKGCPGHSLLEQIARTSLDQALLHGSETPLLFVPADAPAIPRTFWSQWMSPTRRHTTTPSTMPWSRQVSNWRLNARGSCTCSRLTTCPSPCWPTLTLPALG